jgi:hypothetical protein
MTVYIGVKKGSNGGVYSVEVQTGNLKLRAKRTLVLLPDFALGASGCVCLRRY